MKKLLGLLLMFSILLSGCSNLREKNKKLAGKEYILVQENSIPNILIGFDENNFYGFSGLNNYFGKYKRKGNEIELEKLGSTLMAGPNKVMEMETQYLDKLDNVQSVKIQKDQLIFTLKDGSTLNYKENKKTK